MNSSLFINQLTTLQGNEEKQTQKLRVSDLSSFIEIPFLSQKDWVEISKGYQLQRNIALNLTEINTAITSRLESLLLIGVKNANY